MVGGREGLYEGMAWQDGTLWPSSKMHDATCTQDGHRCQESEQVGNRGIGQPRASLAISPMECLATKGRAIKANRSDSLGARLIEKQNPRIQHVSRTPRGLTPSRFHPRRPLSEPVQPSPQPSSHSSDHLRVASSPPVPDSVPVPRTHSPHSLSLRLGLHPWLTHTHSFSPSPFLPPPPPSLGHSGPQKPATPSTRGSQWTQRERPPAALTLPTPPASEQRAGSVTPGPVSPSWSESRISSRLSCLRDGQPEVRGWENLPRQSGWRRGQGRRSAVLRTDVPPGGTWRQWGEGDV